MKLYLKKMLLTALFLLAFNVIYAVLAVLLMQFLFWFKPQENTLIYISLILTTGVMLHFVFLKRWENKRIKATYLESQLDQEYSFKKDFLETVRSREIVIHTLAYVTIDAVQTVPVGIAYGANFLRLIVGTIRAVTPGAIVFTLLNTLVWCIVHRKWYKSRFGTNHSLNEPV